MAALLGASRRALSSMVKTVAEPTVAGVAARGFATAGPNRVFVVGVGMTKFEKPGSREDFDYPDMVRRPPPRAGGG